MVKSYKGVKTGRGCEGITVSRRCAADGASTFGQALPRVVVDGSYGFLRFLRGTKGFVQLQIKVSFEFGGLISTGYLPVVVEKLSEEKHAVCLKWQGLLHSSVQADDGTQKKMAKFH